MQALKPPSKPHKPLLKTSKAVNKLIDDIDRMINKEQKRSEVEEEESLIIPSGSDGGEDHFQEYHDDRSECSGSLDSIELTTRIEEQETNEDQHDSLLSLSREQTSSLNPSEQSVSFQPATKVQEEVI